MYIEKYWGNFIGGSDDSLNLVEFLVDQKKDELSLSEVFAKIGLDKQNWDFRQTVEYLEFTHSNGVEMDFHFAIDVVTDLAAILLECSVSGSVNLHDLDEYNTPSRHIRINATPEEHKAMNKALADFAQNPMEYDLSDMMGEDEITDMAKDVEAIRQELYEVSGRNRNYHVKAEDVKNCSKTGLVQMAALLLTVLQWRAVRLATATGKRRTATGTAAGVLPPVMRARRTWTTPIILEFIS